jgi:hypothetical protein
MSDEKDLCIYRVVGIQIDGTRTVIREGLNFWGAHLLKESRNYKYSQIVIEAELPPNHVGQGFDAMPPGRKNF